MAAFKGASSPDCEALANGGSSVASRVENISTLTNSRVHLGHLRNPTSIVTHLLCATFEQITEFHKVPQSENHGRARSSQEAAFFCAKKQTGP